MRMFIRNSQILAIQKSRKIKTEEFTMREKCCNKCGSKELYIKEKGNQTGLYCSDCGAWIKWLSKNEKRVFMNKEIKIDKEIKANNILYNNSTLIQSDIPLGRLCCFKELGKRGIYFGHMAGKVVDDFENMTFLYVLKCDNRYFFSKEVIEKPIDVHTSKDAEKYLIEKYS